MACRFCNLETGRIVAQNALAVAVRDDYPVNLGHTLLIPRRHFESLFNAMQDECAALMALMDDVKEGLDKEFHPDGYNIGINVGEAAGQTVMHLHIHVIPRFAGDVDDPAGGVRFVIPARGNYRRPGHIPRARE